MAIELKNVQLRSAGMFLPGDAIDNGSIDRYVAPLNRRSERLKRRILAENGIRQRYYAIDADGVTRFSHAQIAAQAVRDCLQRGGLSLDEISLLAVGSSGGDAIVPGFASQIQGELAAPPMELLSSQGVCASGVAALAYAAQAVELGAHRRAVVVGADAPSRLFKRSRFAPSGYDTDFDAHFLRWMLSDGAGAWALGRSDDGIESALPIKLRWVHTKSFGGDHPVCMQLGLPAGRTNSFLDYPSAAAAEADGALALRQDIRLLPHLFDVGIHEYAALVDGGWVEPKSITHFLCHYSSERFIPVIDELMRKANLAIPRERWYSNLAWRGNTGAASIFVMLAEFLATHLLRPGDRILCFVPESGRFTVGYLLLEVEADRPGRIGAVDDAVADARIADTGSVAKPSVAEPPVAKSIPAPIDAGAVAGHPAAARLVPTLRELAAVWHDYRSRAWRTPLVRKIQTGTLQRADYLAWIQCWIPQVREGAAWMRRAVDSLGSSYADVAALIGGHADEEQFDFRILFDDYRRAGGTTATIEALRRNPGGEALNSYLLAYAGTPDPVGLLGAIYVIEGTGARIVPALLPLLRQHADVPRDALRFLDYHGGNDDNHLARWLRALELVLDVAPDAGTTIVETAKATAQLYLLQWRHALDTVGQDDAR